jgi:HK97 gp10 family phage protein
VASYAAITGADRLYANLDFLDRYFGTEAMPVTMTEQRAVAQDIAARARELAPVKTGFLRENIIVIEGSNQTEIASLAPYSLFVEFGTARTAAKPFLRPAYHSFQYFQRVSARHRDNITKGLV